MDLEAAAAPARAVILGRYQVLAELGHGSMATLYLARAQGTGGFERLFALKVPHAHLARRPRFVAMFENEARIAARIQHPNVVTVYDVGVADDRHYLAMDYVSGETMGLLLSRTWSAGRPLPPSFAAYIVAQVAEGLYAAHELQSPSGERYGIVHRDVAPQNILIGYDGTVRLADFGLAKALDTVVQTQPGIMRGTVAYMAPEQVLCRELDHRSDLFALGTILWEATVGMRLFRHQNDLGTAARVLKLDVPPPSSLRPGYPMALEAIVLKALQRAPEDRYQSGRALANDLHAFLRTAEPPATASTIEALMKETFAKRFAERREMERQARETRGMVPSLTETPSQEMDALVAEELVTNDLPIAPPSPVSRSLSLPRLASFPPEPVKNIPGPTWWVAGSAFLVFALWLGLRFDSKSEVSAESLVVQTSIDVPPLPPEPSIEAPPAPFSEVSLRGLPNGALIFVDGVPTSTPFRFEGSAQLRVEAAGYLPLSRTLTASDAGSLLLQLQPQPPPPQPRRRAAPKPLLFEGADL